MTPARIVAVLAISLVAVHCDTPGDRVTSLPGYAEALPFPVYSGYINIPSTDNMGQKVTFHTHYVLYKQLGGVTNGPLTLWQNGGPGSSSITNGMLHEQGYFQLLEASSSHIVNGAPQLYTNPYSWNHNSSMMYWDFPPGVRFSYCTSQATGLPVSCNLDDQSQGKLLIENIAEIVNNMFTEYKDAEVHIAGESYGGIYIPTAAFYYTSLKPAPFNLKGIAVGNGCFAKECNSENNAISIAMVLHGHGLISLETFKKFYAKCQPGNNNGDECTQLQNSITAESGNYDPYYVYDYCPGGDAMDEEAPRFPKTMKSVFEYKKKTGHFEHTSSGVTNDTYSVAGGHFYLCRANAVTDWIENKNVQSALHVQGKNHLSAFNYTGFITDTWKYYPTLIKRMKVLVYYGDSDTVCPQPEGDLWTSTYLNFSTRAPWRPWYESGQVQAGSIKVYEDSEGNELPFLTIRDSGHLVPTFQPRRAQLMFQNFLSGTPFHSDVPARKRA